MGRDVNHLLNLVKRHQNYRRAIQQIHTQLIFTTAENAFNPSSIPIILTLWNSVIRHYSLGILPQEAFFLFQKLRFQYQKVIFFDSFTYLFLIKASANLEQFYIGKQLHCLSLKDGFESHVYVQTALVNMYGECGLVREAKKVFDKMPVRNSVTWNALISGFVKWGDVKVARAVFDAMPEKNVISWTGLIDGYTRMGRFNEALTLFREMVVVEGIKPSEVSLLAIFPAIWNVRCLECCQMVHAYGEKSGINAFDIRVMNSLVDAYAKCGSIDDAVRVFEDIIDERRNLVSWTSIISGCAMHGMAKEASDSYQMMVDAGVEPNRITFLSMLNACSHGGLVDEGLEFFRKMVDEFGIQPDIKHYGSLIDMLGREGRLVEAEEIALEIPNAMSNVVIWRTLLGACSFHDNADLGERVMQKIMEMENKYGGDYVLLSNILAGMGRYVDSEVVRRVMDEQNALKAPGLSFT
uniref:Pentatricopeptide repeat-containing protein At1g09220, mitochondrial n=1 Tax=Nicotiana tabacum TaxID=4097 RepID=A0A1S4ALQ9_TOBAC|nr:PREDICTED: pentatricopeptide repeat-containing protein At1g09220, mitochondrial [Nicotiana tabacum]XP_033515220.1 pentatricopeptide repeat-containing protein At1g09220, mitochondrial [Nicotiana tomentosiformis]XP_033515221.1 pentatricopeptide repeat-containing protein At1g09220, mitochondrial [Nicotiana tomentosiformis]